MVLHASNSAFISSSISQGTSRPLFGTRWKISAVDTWRNSLHTFEYFFVVIDIVLQRNPDKMKEHSHYAVFFMGS